MQRGSLKINKAVEGGPAGAGMEKEYTFTVTVPYDYSKDVTIKGVGSETLTGLLPGTYHVKEADASVSGYTREVSGNDVDVEVLAKETAEVTITNTYTEIIPGPEFGSLTVIKALNGGGSAAQTKEYTFTVTGPKGYQAVFTVTGSGRHTLTNLEPGQYLVVEDDASISGYYWSVTGNNQTVAVVAKEESQVTVTNTYTTPGNPLAPDLDPNPIPDPEIPEPEVPLDSAPQTGDTRGTGM